MRAHTHTSTQGGQALLEDPLAVHNIPRSTLTKRVAENKKMSKDFAQSTVKQKHLAAVLKRTNCSDSIVSIANPQPQLPAFDAR